MHHIKSNWNNSTIPAHFLTRVMLRLITKDDVSCSRNVPAFSSRIVSTQVRGQTWLRGSGAVVLLRFLQVCLYHWFKLFVMPLNNYALRNDLLSGNVSHLWNSWRNWRRQSVREKRHNKLEHMNVTMCIWTVCHVRIITSSATEW